MAKTIEARRAAGLETAQPSRERVIPAIYLLFLSYPVFWALGLPWLWGPVVTLPMLVWVVGRFPKLRLPPGFAFWILFVAWALVSGTELRTLGADRWARYVWTLSEYYTGTLILIYVFNRSSRDAAIRSTVFAVAGLWVAIAILGAVSLALPGARLQTPAATLLPSSVLSIEVVREQAVPSLSQVQNILGFPVVRPAAPYTYTNPWAANFVLTAPFAALAIARVKAKGLKLALAVLLLVGLVPLVFSVSRGAWVALVVMLIYWGIRAAVRWDALSLVAVLLLLGTLSAVVFFTPLRGIIEARLAHPHSDEGRIAQSEEAVRRTWDSPLLGYGSPLPSEEDSTSRRNVATHGQIWFVLFSHGVPGLLFFLAWFLSAFWRTRRARSPAELIAHLLVLAVLVMMPVYTLGSTGLAIVMATIALASRDRRTYRRSAGVPAELSVPTR